MHSTGRPSLTQPWPIGRGATTDLSLVHLFAVGDQYFLVDGATAALVRLDEGAFRSWQAFLTPNQAGKLKSAIPVGYSELLAAGLFRQPVYPQSTVDLASGLHSLCLNVAHACDLRCTYCFASGGDYGQAAQAVMPAGVACQAVDYLLANAPAGRTVNIDFFGGEPLLAWDTIVKTVQYASGRACETERAVHFTLTTNGASLTPTQAGFCAEHMATIIVSLDGREAIHDGMRRQADGSGSYQQALAGARLLQAALDQKRPSVSPGRPDRGLLLDRPDRPTGSAPLWVRGTFTRSNLDFWRDVEHLRKLGFTQISMEPVSAAPDQRYAITIEDLPEIRDSYRRIATMVRAGEIRFFHFELNQDHPACAAKRYTGCAAGAGYGCVTPLGELYPCHQFDGCEGFSQGSIGELTGYPAVTELASAHVGAKAACRRCWAQLYCGGGCHYASWRYGGGVLHPPQLYCELTKTRLEWALSLGSQHRQTPSLGSS